MGKKKQNRGRARKEKKGAASQGRSQEILSAEEKENRADLRAALETCSLARLSEIYDSCVYLVEHKYGKSNVVSKIFKEQDPAAASSTMIAHIVDSLPFLGPMNIMHSFFTQSQLDSVGGMRITFVKATKKQKGYWYTTGFASFGGKEILVRNLHSSMSHSCIRDFLNFLFKQHKDGHPLGIGYTAQCGEIALFVTSPDPEEAILIKATMTLGPTRCYGIRGYGILLLNPVAVNETAGDVALTGEEILGMTLLGTKHKGFQPLGGETKELEACAFCRQTWDTSQREDKLFKCGGCSKAFYCSVKCRDLHWPHHKESCRSAHDAASDSIVMKELRDALSFIG